MKNIEVLLDRPKKPIDCITTVWAQPQYVQVRFGFDQCILAHNESYSKGFSKGLLPQQVMFEKTIWNARVFYLPS